MKTYLPKSLNLEKHLKKFPPTNIDNFHIDNLKYILGLITRIPARSEHFNTNTGMVPLNAEVLRKKIRNYNQYLDYAVKTGILVTDNSYTPGEKSRGFRYSDQYLDKVEADIIIKYSLVRKERNEKRIDPHAQKKYSYLTKWFDDDLEIDQTGAFGFIETTLAGEENIGKYNYNYCRIHMLNDHEYYMSVDGAGQRFHSNLTSFNSDLRNFISYSGEELVSIDIKNSQPFMSTILFSPEFYDSETKNSSRVSLDDIYSDPIVPGSYKFFPSPMLYKLLDKSGNQDVTHYIELVTNGLLYEYLAEEINDELGIEFHSRKALKETVLKDMFTGNQYIGQPEAGPKRVFRDRFPTVYMILACIKRGDKPSLPKLLQRIESHIVLDRICKRIASERPHLPIFTIHDSVITTEGNEDFVYSIMMEELTKGIGNKPTLKIEYWRISQ